VRFLARRIVIYFTHTYFVQFTFFDYILLITTTVNSTAMFGQFIYSIKQRRIFDIDK